jgi:hypothetical protein
MGKPAIFDGGTRNNSRPRLHGESRFAFYNRAAGPVFDRIRDCVDRWFERYPDDGHTDLRARLRSDSEDVFNAAFWELYQHETLTAMGFEVEPHPALPDTPRHPDFLVRQTGGLGFYLEATITTASERDRGSDRQLGTVYDLLNNLPTPNFFLHVEVERRGERSPATKSVRRTLVAWLETLDPDEVESAPGGWPAVEPLRWVAEGWSLLFRPIPKSRAHRGKAGRAIGVNMDKPMGFVDTTSGLRSAVREKAGRYGKLDRPYVIAVLNVDDFANPWDVIDALYGTVSYRFDPSDAEHNPEPFRQLDGPWMSASGPINTRVSAVLTATNISPPLVARIAPHLWLNPWAARPLSDRLAWQTCRVQDGILVDDDADAEPFVLLNLPAEWPGPEEPFPRDA